ncbi:hypothetical protein INT48_007585 [Thamnidium elegans]|uniref:IRG-type G domain-containing protein n=1 Tax=Thamnidium elegans TaxID=101142 RepID=A0A8H7SLZ0_9FUNG|nr:hypothetical protein INT48_007585 [Thamnidium elegans]
MGQATSSPNALSFFQKVTNSDKSEYEDISHKFSKATLSTLTVPVIIIAYPALNAYAFQDMDITGNRMVDGTIGGLLGVIAWPLSPFLAIWGAVKINFKDKPPVPLPISPSLLLKAEQDIKLNTVSFYNVAVCGVSGSGKSSIVNAILGYKDTESRAAKVGEVETTARPSSYQHPDLANMVIWDMPGVGTQKHPIDTKYRVLESDTIISAKAKEHKIPVLYVRSKSDQSIRSKMRRNEGNKNYTEHHAVGELVDEVRNDVFNELRKFKLNTRKLFIVSASTLNLFVATINKKEKRQAIKLIDEQRFMTALIEGVVNKRRQLEKLAKLEEKKKRLQDKNNSRRQQQSDVGNTSNISTESTT